MKKLFSKILILFLVIMMTGCTKDYKKLSYVDYNEYFNKKDGYLMIDHSSENGLEIIRDLEAGNGKLQIIYLEFNNEELADEYIENNYNIKSEKYKIKVKDGYTTVKNTSNKYFKLYKVDNVIIYGVSQDKKEKKEINKVLKDLGY